MSQATAEVTPEVLQAFAEAWNRHDADALMSFMTEDCVFEASAGPDVCGTRHVGREAVRASYVEVWSTFPDAHWGNARHFVHGDRGVSEWTFTGTGPDGTQVEVNGCDLFTFRHGRIAVKNSYRKKRGPMAFQITSSAFRHNGSIPRQHTCEGDDSRPPLAWTGIPENTKSLALIVDDPDAPDPSAPQRTYVHWVVYNLRPAPTILGPELPTGSLEGTNDWNRTGYGGPCPPIGRHRYFFKLYALDTVLPDLQAPTKAQLEAAMEGHIIARTDLIGTYEKTGA